MATLPQTRRIDPRMLQRIILAMYLQQVMAQQGQGGQRGSRGQPQQPTLEEAIRLIRRGRNAYNTGSRAYDAISGLFEGGAAASEGANAAWNAGADAAWQAQQQAWNAGADAASGIESGANSAADGTSGSGVSADGSYAAAAMSALDSFKKLTNKNASDEQKAYDASMAIPRAVAAYYTFGGSTALEGFAQKQWGGTMKKLQDLHMDTTAFGQASKLWTSDKWKTEGNRIKKLLDAGVDVPEQFRGRMYQQRGLKKSELMNPKYAADFQGMTPDGWVNNKFQDSRNESDMTYYDLAPYAVWAEKRNDWWKLSDAQRRAITDRAQAAGAIREQKGTLNVDWDKVGDIDQILATVPQDQQGQVARPGKGQVVRVSPGMYMNDQGRVSAALTSKDAMRQNYGNRIPRSRRR